MFGRAQPATARRDAPAGRRTVRHASGSLFAAPSARAPRSPDPSAPRRVGRPTSHLYNTRARAHTPTSVAADPSTVTSGQATPAPTSRQPQTGQPLDRDDLQAVTCAARIPAEVSDALKHADLYASPFSVSLDPVLGWAYVAVNDRVYVWDWGVSASTSVAPSCFFLQMPSSSSVSQAPSALYNVPMQCVYSFLPWSEHKSEPGLLAVGRVTGHVFFSDSVTSGWSSNQSEIIYDPHARVAAGAAVPYTQLDLASGETITTTRRVGSSSVVFATSQGRLFRVQTYHQSNRIHLAASVIAQPRTGFLGRLLGFGSEASVGHGAAQNIDSIVSLDAHPDPTSSDRALLVAAGRRAVQLWNIEFSSTGGSQPDQVVNTINTSTFAPALVEAMGGTHSAFSEDGLEITAATFLPSGELALLYSFAPAQSRFRSTSTSSGTRKLALCIVSDPSHAHSEVLDAAIYPVRDLDLDVDARTQSAPRLVASGGPVVAIITPNAVVQIVLDGTRSNAVSTILDPLALASQGIPSRTTLHPEAYQHITELLSTRQNRIVGFAAGQSANPVVSNLLLLTSRTGALQLEVNYPDARNASAAYARDTATRTTLQIKDWQRALESAVFFADVPGQPLDLRLHRSIDPSSEGTASLAAAAAETVSRDITAGTAALLPALVDVHQHIADRATRLRSLISVLAEAGVAALLPAPTRQQLAADAQLVQAAEAVWKENFAFASSSTWPLLLVQAIDLGMLSSASSTFSDSEEAQKDTLRQFFRTGLGHWDNVLSQLQQRMTEVLTSDIDLSNRTRAALQVNGFLVPAHLAAEAVRKVTKDPVYAAYNLPAPEAPHAKTSWISTLASIDVLETAFHRTVALLRERSTTLGSLVDVGQPVGTMDAFGGTEHAFQAALRNHLPHLASAALQSYQAALAHIKGLRGLSSSSKTQTKSLLQRFGAAKHRLILPLAELGLADEAIQLAEWVQDFDALATIVLSLRDKDLAKQPQSVFVGGTQSKSVLPKLAPHFLDRYGYPFADALYRRLLSKGEYRTLLAHEHGRLTLDQAQRHGTLLRKFLNPTGPPAAPTGHDPAPAPSQDAAARLRWLVEVGADQPESASETLVRLATTETSSDKKRLELSMSKLAALAQVSTDTNTAQALQVHDPSLSVVEHLTALDDQLHGLKTQSLLIKTLRSTLGDEVDLLQAGGEAADSMVAEKFADLAAANKLDEFPAFRNTIFVPAIERIWKREALGVEALVDVWSLLDDPADQEGGETPATHALNVFLRLGKLLPPARSHALHASVWRRILLNTDWAQIAQTRGLTDEQMRDRLRSTTLYRVLYDQQEEPPVSDLSITLNPTPREVVAARFQSIDEDALNELSEDHAKEVELLRISLASTLSSDLAQSASAGALTLDERQDAELWAWPNQVRHLVVEDKQAEAAAIAEQTDLQFEGWRQQPVPADALEELALPHSSVQPSVDPSETTTATVDSGLSDAIMTD